MEEAEAYGELLARPGATIETVAAALSKSPSYVGRRAQLLKAAEPVRSALKAGAIEVGHALELARLTDAMQISLLQQLNVRAAIGPNDVEDEAGEEGTCRFCGCTEDEPCEGGCGWANEEATICDSKECLERFREEIGQGAQPAFQKTAVSVVELRRMIERQTLRILGDAPFPLDADLAPMPCTDCPKRSSNALLLFSDFTQDTCTDRKCFDAKVQTWIASEVGMAKAQKCALLQLRSGWTSNKKEIEVNGYSHASPKVLESEGECPHGEEGIWLDGEHIGRRAMVCRNHNCKTHYGARSAVDEQKPKATEKQMKRIAQKLLDKVKTEKAYRVALVSAIANASVTASVTAKAAEELQIDVCCALIADTNSQYSAQFAAALGWEEKLFGWGGNTKLRAKVAALPAAKRLLIARLSKEAGELVVSEFNVGGKCKDLEKIARVAGVDTKKVRVAAASARSAAKPAEKPAARPFSGEEAGAERCSEEA